MSAISMLDLGLRRQANPASAETAMLPNGTIPLGTHSWNQCCIRIISMKLH
jgi:hypothetical protein